MNSIIHMKSCDSTCKGLNHDLVEIHDNPLKPDLALTYINYTEI